MHAFRRRQLLRHDFRRRHAFATLPLIHYFLTPATLRDIFASRSAAR